MEISFQLVSQFPNTFIKVLAWYTIYCIPYVCEFLQKLVTHREWQLVSKDARVLGMQKLKNVSPIKNPISLASHGWN